MKMTIQDTSGRCKGCCSYDGNQEARAWAWNSAAQGLVIVNQIFLAVALLRLAVRSAGCEDLGVGEECSNRVYGMRPGSLLTTMTAVTGILSSIVLPPIGALIDRSSYRRGAGIVTATFVVANSATNLIISENTWFIVLMLTVVGTLAYFIHLMVMYSYVPELTDDVEKLTTYNGTYIAIRTAVMAPVLPTVLGLAYLINQRGKKVEMRSLEFDVLLAKTSQVICLVLSSIFFFLTFWKGLKMRPPKIQEESTKNKAKIIETAKDIYTKNPSLFWYLLALIPLANTAMAFASITLTFMTAFLDMDSSFIAMTILIFTLSGIVGSKIHPLIAKKINLMNDLKINVLCWIALCVGTGLLVNNSGKRNLFIGLSVLWGMIFGWAVPSMRTVYITLIPQGQEAEYMGIYILFSGGFVWLPPLLFTILNELGIAMNEIIIIASSLFVITLILLLKVGDYEKAVENAKTLGREKVLQDSPSESDPPISINPIIPSEIESNVIDLEANAKSDCNRTQDESDDSENA